MIVLEISAGNGLLLLNSKWVGSARAESEHLGALNEELRNDTRFGEVQNSLNCVILMLGFEGVIEAAKCPVRIWV